MSAFGVLASFGVEVVLPAAPPVADGFGALSGVLGLAEGDVESVGVCSVVLGVPVVSGAGVDGVPVTEGCGFVLLPPLGVCSLMG